MAQHQIKLVLPCQTRCLTALRSPQKLRPHLWGQGLRTSGERLGRHRCCLPLLLQHPGRAGTQWQVPLSPGRCLAQLQIRLKLSCLHSHRLHAGVDCCHQLMLHAPCAAR
jgi:hypothetical protein